MTQRTANVTWSGSLMDGMGRSRASTAAHSARSTSPGRRVPRIRRDLRAGGADRRRSRCVLLDGALPRARGGGDSALAPRHVGDGDLRPRHRHHEIALIVRGSVPGIDATRIRRGGRGRKEGCPVSKALAAVPEITLEASLAS